MTDKHDAAPIANSQRSPVRLAPCGVIAVHGFRQRVGVATRDAGVDLHGKVSSSSVIDHLHCAIKAATSPLILSSMTAMGWVLISSERCSFVALYPFD